MTPSPSQRFAQRQAGAAFPAQAVCLSVELLGSRVISASQDGLGVRLQLGPYQLLFDCGAGVPARLSPLVADRPLSNQVAPGLGPTAEPLEPERSAPVGEPRSPLNFAFCSHAHGDHAAGFWDLHQARPELPILASAATAYLLSLNWPGQDIPNFCRPWPGAVPRP